MLKGGFLSVGSCQNSCGITKHQAVCVLASDSVMTKTAILQGRCVPYIESYTPKKKNISNIYELKRYFQPQCVCTLRKQKKELHTVLYSNKMYISIDICMLHCLWAQREKETGRESGGGTLTYAHTFIRQTADVPVGECRGKARHKIS